MIEISLCSLSSLHRFWWVTSRFEPLAHQVDRFFRLAAFEGQGGLGLGAVEEDEAPQALVGGDVFLVAAVLEHEIGQGQGVFGVEEGLVVAFKVIQARRRWWNGRTRSASAQSLGRHHPG